MKICLLIHSKTGNTLYVAQKLVEKLQLHGHEIDLVRIEAYNDNETKPDAVRLLQVPQIQSYDVIIVGGPVRGFSFSPVLQAFFLKTPSLQGKKMFGFVTQFFPSSGMGGNQALEQFSNICRNKGGTLIKKGSIQWIIPFTRQALIHELVENFTAELR